MCKLTYRPIKLETVVVMRGEKPVGTIKRYRAHKCVQVSVPGLLSAATAPFKGASVFRTVPEAKKALNALDCPQVSA